MGKLSTIHFFLNRDLKNGVMPLHKEYFYNEELGKKRMQEVVRLLLTDYLGKELLDSTNF